MAGRDTMDATVAEAAVDAVPWNAEALLTGLVSVRVGPNGKVIPEFRIDSARDLGTSRRATRQELEMRWQAAITRPKRNIVRGSYRTARASP